MRKSIRDIGSLFYRLHRTDTELDDLPSVSSFIESDSYALLYSGRHAIFAVLNDILSNTNINTIWLPSYFCHNVVNAIKHKYNKVRSYEVDPFRFNKPLNILEFATKGDVMLVNNFWGLKSYDIDLEDPEMPTIIMDHSHGWRTLSCKESEAHYAICSLRKTYPIPLGAIAWKPNGQKLKVKYDVSNDNSILESYHKLSEAMQLKRKYLEGGEKEHQAKYLCLINEGEDLVSRSNDVVRPKEEHLKEIAFYLDRDPISIKSQNLNIVLEKLNVSQHYRIIHREGFTAFGLMLLFKNKNYFLDFKEYMIANNIYPANLWPNNTLTDKWQYFFNIHVDFRYTLEDMEYLATKLNAWTPIVN